MQTSEVSEDPSCSSNSERGNDLVCWHSTAVAGFETPFVCESYLDSEDSAYGNVLFFFFLLLVSKICYNKKKKNISCCLAITFWQEISSSFQRIEELFLLFVGKWVTLERPLQMVWNYSELIWSILLLFF